MIFCAGLGWGREGERERKRAREREERRREERREEKRRGERAVSSKHTVEETQMLDFNPKCCWPNHAQAGIVPAAPIPEHVAIVRKAAQQRADAARGSRIHTTHIIMIFLSRAFFLHFEWTYELNSV